jgi:ABC-type dipeptide/oligopeptide/nickel transport system permease subunit
MTEGTTQAPALPVTENAVPLRHRSLWRDAAWRFSRNRLAIVGSVIVLFIVILAVFADVLAPYPYDKAFFDKVLLPPFENPDHPLGTDEVGRDYLSRLIYGARTSMTVGLAVVVIAVVIGVPLGSLAGYRGGRTDFVISRLVDVMTAFPGLLFSIFILTIYGGGLLMVIFALGITSWVGILRLTRGQLLSLREKEYIEAARGIGASQWRIMSRHLFPLALAPLLVAISFQIPTAIFGEAGLSFLGIGINDPIPSWGKMVGTSNAYIRVYWHLALFPTLMIALTMLGFSFVGDGLRDALDPRQIQ